MPKAGSSKSTIVLQSLSGGLNVIGIPINKDAENYIRQGNNIPNESIVRVGSTDMTVTRQNGFVLYGNEIGKPSNTMRVDLRNESAKLLYRAEIQSQAKFL